MANSNNKISLAVIGGLVPGVMWSLEPAQGGNWRHVPERVLMAYTGYNPISKQLELNYLSRGLLPLMLGMVAHMIAEKVGINRRLKKWLPVII